MTDFIVASIFLCSLTVFWVGIFSLDKDRDGDNSYFALFVAVAVMSIAGVVLAIRALG